MRQLVACAAALALLSACAETAEEPAEEPAMVEDTTATAVEPEELVGTWSYTWPEGMEGTTTVSADGTYTREMSDGLSATGTWQVDGDQACFTDEGALGSRCYTVGPVAADGSRLFTRTDGEEMTVRPAT